MVAKVPTETIPIMEEVLEVVMELAVVVVCSRLHTQGMHFRLEFR